MVGKPGKDFTQELLQHAVGMQGGMAGTLRVADTCAAWKRKVTMEKGEKSIMKQYQQSRPPATPSKLLGFATGLLIFLLLVILGHILYGF